MAWDKPNVDEEELGATTGDVEEVVDNQNLENSVDHFLSASKNDDQESL